MTSRPSRPVPAARPLLALPAALLAAAVGCAAPQARQAAAPAAFSPPDGLKWFRTAAEREVAYAQAYRQAGEVVARTAPASGPWAVVLDADDTVLDTSAYEDRLARAGEKWSAPTWNAWVHERSAPAFPPAREFIAAVRARGGKVAIVTNRDEALCGDTRENLRAQGVDVDALLCAPPGSGAKQPRFDKVASGAAFPDGKPVTVLLFVGDNIQDCPGQTQAQHDPALFGQRCIVLPNPMYGSWTGNAYR